MDGMISAYLVQLELSGHADKPYKEEVDGTGQLTTSGNPFKTTIFMTLAKDLRSMYDNFGPQTSKAKTVSVYTLEKCFNAILDISRIENGVEPRDPTVKTHIPKKGNRSQKSYVQFLRDYVAVCILFHRLPQFSPFDVVLAFRLQWRSPLVCANLHWRAL